MKKFIEESAQFLKERGFEAPEIGIILGTGLGQFVDKVEIISSVSYTTSLIFQPPLLNSIPEN